MDRGIAIDGLEAINATDQVTGQKYGSFTTRQRQKTYFSEF
jgi:hypothetical protein